MTMKWYDYVWISAIDLAIGLVFALLIAWYEVAASIFLVGLFIGLMAWGYIR